MSFLENFVYRFSQPTKTNNNTIVVGDFTILFQLYPTQLAMQATSTNFASNQNSPSIFESLFHLLFYKLIAKNSATNFIVPSKCAKRATNSSFSNQSAGKVKLSAVGALSVDYS
jgi:hypothetical protein